MTPCKETTCTDTIDFADLYGTCAMYEQYKWCNHTGGPGSGWDAEWGDLSPVVAESCCACGKKTQNTGTCSLIHLTRVECRCQHREKKNEL